MIKNKQYSLYAKENIKEFQITRLYFFLLRRT